MKSFFIAFVAALALVSQVEAARGLIGACKTQNYTTKNVDFGRYVGKWYELASSESFFQGRDCFCTTAEYTLLPTGLINVRNECNKGGVEGGRTGNTGSARVVGPGKLAVTFFGPESPYEVVALDEENYQWAGIVSCSDSPFGGSNVWIIARDPTLPEETFQSIRKELLTIGFDLTDQRRTVQDGCVYKQ
ncbi:Calycin-like protein [Paraphysoderma sedebokerense]|nr:Calycin-like protein [Paraphysoderma sedebokerense]